MSLGYAEKLSYREDLGGQLGAPEHFDGPLELEAKVAALVKLVKEARRVVAFTGAGISTSIGIPDFRGPSGIWTLQRSNKPLPQMRTSFVAAAPSYTHQALLSLLRCGKLSYIVSQNVDGLHLRSGVPRDRISELHGNCFAERCEACRAEYVRDFEIETVGFKHTKRRCTAEGCGGRLRDHILDWEDALPPEELELAEQHAREADLAICLGTSLQITPACNLPLLTVKAGGKMAIVNLQKTPKDKKASLVIHARCDEVMRRLMSGLGLVVLPYTRRDTVALFVQQHPPRLKPSSSRGGSLAAAALPAAAAWVPEGPSASTAAMESASEAGGASVSVQTASEAVPSGAQSAALDGWGRSTGSGSSEGEGAEVASPSSQEGHDAAAGTREGSPRADSIGGAAVQLPSASAQPQLGSYSFTLAVQNQYGPKWAVPLLESVEFSFEDPQLKAGVKEQPPFSLTRTARQPGDYAATLTLRLSAAADEGRREVCLPFVVRLLPPPPPAQQQAGGGGRGRGRPRGKAAGHQPQHGHQQQQQLFAEQRQLLSFVTQVVHYDAPAEGTDAPAAAAAAAPAPPGVSEAGAGGPAPAKRLRQE